MQRVHHSFLSALRKSRSLPLLVLIAIVLVIPVTLVLVQQSHVFQSNAAGTLPIPQNVKVEQDDRNAILWWDNAREAGYAPLPDGVTGYVIYWGVYNSSTQTITSPSEKLTSDKTIQLQPLTPGITYGAYVESVDTDGNVSSPTPIVTFQSDSSRVDTLRTQMTGFFDDFNLPGGGFDELKWNNADSGCVGDDGAGQFINTQFHAHNQVSDIGVGSAQDQYNGITQDGCDRGDTVSRPRAIFDFTNRTGTVTFDSDSLDGRAFFYLDFEPVDTSHGNPQGITDISGHVNIDSNDAATDPANGLRISNTGSNIKIYQFNQAGFENEVTAGSSLCGDDLQWCQYDLRAIHNVRYHYKVLLSQTHIQIYINGILVIDKPLSLTFSKAYIHWAAFSYNTPKGDLRDLLLHWDNFGFDGPAPTVETHNYRDQYINGPHQYTVNGTTCHFPCADTNDPYTDTIPIPDSLAGNIAERLMFTLQMSENNKYQWSSSDHVTVNGKDYPMPNPDTLKTATGPTIQGDYPDLINGIEPFSLTIPVNNLQTGTNTIVFHLTEAGILNVHAEIDFPKGSAPAYTQPTTIFHQTLTSGTVGQGLTPIVPDIGPIFGLGNIPMPGQTDPNWYASGEWYQNQFPIQSPQTGKTITWSGQIPMQVWSDPEPETIGTGTNPGIYQWDVYIDRQLAYTKDTHQTVLAPSITDTFTWDTTKYCNGLHEVFFIAYNGNGSPSFSNVIDSHSPQGFYFPQFMLTNNTNQTSCPSTWTKQDINGNPVATTQAAPAILHTLPAAFLTPQSIPVNGGATATPTLSANPSPTNTPTPIIDPTGPLPTNTPTVKPTNTPTPLQTNTPIPTNTPVPSSTTLSFPSILLQGIGKAGDSVNPGSTGNLTPLHPSRTVSVSLYNGAAQLVTTKTGTITYQSATGDFKGSVDLGSTVPSGTYTVKVSVPQYLVSQVVGFYQITPGQTVSLPQFSMVVGDANGDNKLDILDYNLLLGCYADLTPATNCPGSNKSLTDFSDDGAVNQTDYNLFLRELSVRTGQ